MVMRVLDTFAGIGGFSLGLEWASSDFETVAFCEIDPYCQKVLAKHWPGVPCYEDIRTLSADRLRRDGIIGEAPTLADAPGERCGQGYSGRTQSHGEGRGDSARQVSTDPGGPEQGGREQSQRQPYQRDADAARDGEERRIDILTGGFPCQDISHAGKQGGIEAERSGLWTELCRLTGELRPSFAVFENVSALASGGDGLWFATVLRDLAAIGFDAEWHCISAAHVGAPHLRDRIWIVAYPQHPDTDLAGSHPSQVHQHGGAELRHEQVGQPGSVRGAVPDTDQGRREVEREPEHGEQQGACRRQPDGLRPGGRGQGPDVADPDGGLETRPGQTVLPGRDAAVAGSETVADGQREGLQGHSGHGEAGGGSEPDGPTGAPSLCGGQRAAYGWESEPNVGRVADGVPNRVDRLKCLGNAIVPQMATLIGRAILEVKG